MEQVKDHFISDYVKLYVKIHCAVFLGTLSRSECHIAVRMGVILITATILAHTGAPILTPTVALFLAPILALVLALSVKQRLAFDLTLRSRKIEGETLKGFTCVELPLELELQWEKLLRIFC